MNGRADLRRDSFRAQDATARVSLGFVEMEYTYCLRSVSIAFVRDDPINVRLVEELESLDPRRCVFRAFGAIYRFS